MTLLAEQVLKLPCIDNNIGNATVYVKLLDEYLDCMSKWGDKEWFYAHTAYYTTVHKPSSAWMHDIYKNRCDYNIKDTYTFINNLVSIGSNL